MEETSPGAPPPLALPRGPGSADVGRAAVPAGPHRSLRVCPGHSLQKQEADQGGIPLVVQGPGELDAQQRGGICLQRLSEMQAALTESSMLATARSGRQAVAGGRRHRPHTHTPAGTGAGPAVHGRARPCESRPWPHPGPGCGCGRCDGAARLGLPERRRQVHRDRSGCRWSASRVCWSGASPTAGPTNCAHLVSFTSAPCPRRASQRPTSGQRAKPRPKRASFSGAFRAAGPNEAMFVVMRPFLEPRNSQAAPESL